MTRTLKLDGTAARVALLLAASIAWSSAASAQTRYTASWTSLDTHNPAPEWFQDAKFGIYYHWGAWCVAAFGSEWYPRNMYNRSGNSSEYQHHLSTFGDPFGSWGYDKFLTGADDKSGKLAQFAPQLKSDGGAWDPDEWAQLFLDAGAKFAGPVAEHHDGFSMWDSKVNEWNSVAMGPKLDLAKLQADAIRKKGMKLIMSHHTAYNFTGFYQWVPTGATDSLKKLYGQLPNATEQTLWLNKLKEIIDQFLPDIIWQDFNLGQVSSANLTEFLAYYYNAGLDADKEVVATAKDGITINQGHKGQVLDFERGGPADITTPYWLTDDAVSSSSWSYTTGMRYYGNNNLIHSFVDRVSKGGNLLLNLSPMADGTFPQEQKNIMAAFGKFLKQMGTAIYNTRTFAVYGEGPTKMGGGGMTSPTAMTSSDVRYTKSKDGDAVYALLMGWPGDGKQVNLTAVTTSRFALGSGKVFMFGPSGDGSGAIELQATQDGSGVHITLPSAQPYTSVAYAIKISRSGTQPEPTPWIGSTSTPDGGVAGAGGSSGAGGSGTSGTGGTSSGLGGSSNSGGNRGAGGATGAGGAMPTGGNSGGGASSGASGSTARGGSGGTASGGAAGTPGTGGTAGSSGNAGVGGASAAGGSGGVGGASGSGGAVDNGGSGGTTVTRSTTANGCSCSSGGQGIPNTGGALLLLGLIVASLVRRGQTAGGPPTCGSRARRRQP